MKVSNVVLTLLTSVVISESFEPPTFNAAQALHSHGVDVNQLQRSVTSGQCSCADACSMLDVHYGPSYVLPKNSTAYTAFREAYWSTRQADVYPHCIFQPPDAKAVSVLILLSRLTQCPFAFKSGGHSAFPGGASIQDGITVSLQNLDSIELSADKKVALVEPGNNWLSTYSRLGQDDLTVVGGRVARIGVGGLTLGGGISFFSGLNGWACDNVEAYELVTASGEQITVTLADYPDLYWALRGGGNNFGIVTKFHLRTFPIPGGDIWGGTRVYMPSQFPGLVKAFTNLAINAEEDPRAGQWSAFIRYNKTNLASTTLWYDNPANITNTKIFRDYDRLTAVSDSTQRRNLANFTMENQETNPYGLREVFWAFTTKVSAELASFAIDTFYASVDSLDEVSGVLPVLLFQSITVPQMVHMARNGGNPLGLDPKQGPLYLWSVPIMWNNAADDSKVYTFISDVLRKINSKAKEMGLQNNYIYMNYASQFQDVIRGYGPVNQAKLIKIAKKYDPEGVFQVLQPGYFKLNGPPVVSDYFSGDWS